MWLIVYSNDHAPLTVRPIYSCSKLRTAQMMIFSLVAMIGLEKKGLTSACLQWLCHSGERTVAHGPLVFVLFFVSTLAFISSPSELLWSVNVHCSWTVAFGGGGGGGIKNSYNCFDQKSKKSWKFIFRFSWTEFFKPHLLPNSESDWAETWWEESQWHRDSELLKLFHSDIQFGRHGGHIEILQTTSPPKP